jgi:hypothetical protein
VPNSVEEPGPGVDIRGRAVVDPTKNVLDLVEAAITRIDDLRAAENKRQDDLREAGERHAREISKLTAIYEEKLADAETDRIDAIRAVDVAAVQRAAEVQAAQAQALATQVTVSAEALRNQVAAAATASATALASALDPIQKTIVTLQQFVYEATGQKTQVVETRAAGGSAALWIGLAIAGLVGFFSVMVSIIAIAYALAQ